MILLSFATCRFLAVLFGTILTFGSGFARGPVVRYDKIIVKNELHRQDFGNSIVGPAIFNGSIKRDFDSGDVYLEFSLGYNFKNPYNSENSITETIPLKNEREFCFKTSSLQKIEKLSYFVIGVNTKRFGYANFVVEPGDSVFMNTTIINGKPMVRFSGRGSDKYNCRFSIERIDREYNDSINAISAERGSWSKWQEHDFHRALRIYSDSQNKMEAELQFYKSNIDDDVYMVMLADIRASRLKKAQLLWNIRSSAENVSSELLKRAFKSEFSNLLVLPDSLSYLSPDYIDYLANLTALDLYLNREEGIPSFDEVYSRAKHLFKGETMERILYVLIGASAPIISPNSLFYKLDSSEKLKFLNDALVIFNNAKIKDRIKAISNAYLKGVKAFKFCLPDTAQKRVCLDDFRGKVVVLDLWFTGCGGCARLADAMRKHVKPKLEGRNIAFVSISTDEDREKWLSSVKSQLYSERTDVNLYTAGYGFQHDIVKYYGLVGLPFLLVIDEEGKIVSAVPGDDIEGILRTVCAALNKELE